MRELGGDGGISNHSWKHAFERRFSAAGGKSMKTESSDLLAG